MDKSTLNWFWIIIILPVAGTIFRAELGKFWNAYSTYKNRAFDLDGDPNTPNNCQIFNGATGVFGDAIIEKYVFWGSMPSKWGVDVLYPDGGREHFSYSDWKLIRKRTPPPANK